MLALLEQAIIRDPGSVEARIQATDILVSLLADALSSSIDEDEAQAEQLIGDALERASWVGLLPSIGAWTMPRQPESR